MKKLTCYKSIYNQDTFFPILNDPRSCQGIHLEQICLQNCQKCNKLEQSILELPLGLKVMCCKKNFNNARSRVVGLQVLSTVTSVLLSLSGSWECI